VTCRRKPPTWRPCCHGTSAAKRSRKQAPTAADLLPGRWDDELAAELLRAGVSDPLAAGPINDTTRADLAQILATIPETRAAVRALFDRYAEVRVPQLAAELTR
jgi:hypothetical protein